MKSAFLFSFLIYILLNSFVFYQRAQSTKRLEKFDLNKNGFIDNEEITPESTFEVRKASSDTGMALAPLTTIPISMFFGLIFILLLKLFPKRLYNSTE